MSNAKHKIVPKLRFPEFEDDWELGILEDLVNTVMGNAFKSKDFVNDGVQLVRMGNLYQGKLQLDRLPIFLPYNFSKDYKKFFLYPLDILMSMTGTVGKKDYGFVIQIPENSPNLFLNQRVVKIVPKGNCIQKFLLQLLKSQSFLQILYSLPGGTKQANLSIGQLKGIEIFYPKNKNEQKKIAACLSSLDNIIDLETQKLNNFKNHKKGLLQKLFPAEGASKPQFRFQEFKNDGDWEEKTIDDIKSIVTDYVANGSFASLKENVQINTSKDYAYYVRLTDLRAGIGHKEQKFVTKKSYAFLNKSCLFGEELLMANIGANVGEVWQMPKVDKPATLAPNMIMAKFKDNVEDEFIYYFLNSELGTRNISVTISGNAHPKINKTEFKQVKVVLPKNKEEQKKIAACLSSVDDLISTQIQKIAALKAHKKGLMQQLFPNVNQYSRMSKPRIYNYPTLSKLVTRLRDDLNNQDFVLLFAFNGIGKTRLSMAFKEKGKTNGNRDTLYFNAFTEDLFVWNNDLENDEERYLTLNSDSTFFNEFKGLALEEKIDKYLKDYATFNFKIDYSKWKISFSKLVKNPAYNAKNPNNTEPKLIQKDDIKVSRGEENIFIWCIFLAICQLAIDAQEEEAYSWVKYIYIDDPISSLDDNNVIAIACDLAKLLTAGKDKVKTVVSTHHTLFFNIMYNELKNSDSSRYFLHKNKSESYALQKTNDTPFFHHIAMLSELEQVAKSEKIYTYHFNVLRSILEKTASFFGYSEVKEFIKTFNEEGSTNSDTVTFNKVLDMMSHGNYTLFKPAEMLPDNKILFKRILNGFLGKYKFNLPEIFNEETETAQ